MNLQHDSLLAPETIRGHELHAGPFELRKLDHEAAALLLSESILAGVYDLGDKSIERMDDTVHAVCNNIKVPRGAMKGMFSEIGTPSI